MAMTARKLYLTVGPRRIGLKERVAKEERRGRRREEEGEEEERGERAGSGSHQGGHKRATRISKSCMS